MRGGALGLLVLCCALWAGPLPAGEGQKPKRAKRPGEYDARLEVMTRLPFLTPKEALGEFTRVRVDGGKGKLPISGKEGPLEVTLKEGRMSLVPPAGSGKSALSVPVPPKGFSWVISTTFTRADGSTAKVAVAFARTGAPGEFSVRNMAVAVAQAGYETVYVIDENCNGRYNDAGEDAIIAGRGQARALAAPLGGTIMLGNLPYTAEIAPGGGSMVFTKVKDARLGLAAVAAKEGFRQLIGAVVKGPGGSYFVIDDKRPAVLPVGGYSLAFASFGNPLAGKLAVLRGGSASISVSAERKVALMRFGLPKLETSARYEPKSNRVIVKAPKSDGVTCKAGTFKFFFPLGNPKVDIYKLLSNAELKTAHAVGMGMNSRTHEPRDLSFELGKHGVYKGPRYRFVVRWASGVVEEARGTAELKIPVSTGGKKK